MGLHEQVDLVRRYIREGKYDQARDILRTIDHPKAREWLRKIDSISVSNLSSSANFREAEVQHIRSQMRTAYDSGYYVFGSIMWSCWFIVALSMLSLIGVLGDASALLGSICTFACVFPTILPLAVISTLLFIYFREKRKIFV